jgi:putative component of membrane protein insertase Oxa1/YidC/SpoIIIJ protein YidD
MTLKRILIKSINFYQKYLSFDTGLPKKLGISRGFVCMHYPTCSEYTKQAIQKYGAIQGSKLGLTRISRCRPGKEPTIDLLV